MVSEVIGAIGIVLSVLALLFMIFTIRSVRSDMSLYEKDLRTWQMLAGRGLPVVARIKAVSRHAGRLTRAGSQGNNQVAAVTLTVSWDDGRGSKQEACVSTFIETELLANFVTGRDLPIAVHPDEPSLIAIDRSRVQLEIESTKR